MKQALIIFVRRPELGKVKTRLAATVGEERALDIYHDLLFHTKKIAENVRADKFIYYAGEVVNNDLWSGAGFYKKLQVENSLGEKMSAAFDDVFALGYSKVCIIGSDCLELTSALIEKSFESLDSREAVIGPALDGGYYLLGMTEPLKPVFQNKAWSTSAVFNQTVSDFEKLNLSYQTLPVLRDVDTEEDWIHSSGLINTL